MKVKGQHYHSIWVHPEETKIIQIIDQRHLPHQFIIEDLSTVTEAADAIREMHVRGAPLIGATAAYGVYLAALEGKEKSDFKTWIKEAATLLKETRPTAVNLAWAVDQQLALIEQDDKWEVITKKLFENANTIASEDAHHCSLIGQHGLAIIKNIQRQKSEGAVVNILTHCNAGWLACVDYGTATSPMYAAHEAGIPIHVWVDETRPRNQGARITAWELQQHGIPHTVIPDNTGGHLMQHGMVDLVLVGSDRTTRTGDVANKIGTYLKALAAHANQVPFYVALPASSIDWKIRDGIQEIPIEQRNGAEVKYIQGLHEGAITKVLLTPDESPVANFAFDVTPAHLVTGLITERGICGASEESLIDLFPEFR